MQPAIDPFLPLLEVVDRYRQDVHQLQPPCSIDALEASIEHIGQPLPLAFSRFLQRWNGAILFRGALRIRSAPDLASASERARNVVVFADGPLETDRWAFAPGAGHAVFGRWDDNGFEPLHESFEKWLEATIRILDETAREPEQRLKIRLEVDPECGFLMFKEAKRVLAAGDPDQAHTLLRKATVADSALVGAWQALGDTLLGEDSQAAQWAYLKAFRTVRLPATVQLADPVGPGLLRTMARLFPAGDDGWERELVRFLGESVTDLHHCEEMDLAEAAVVELATVRLARGEREAAHEALTDFLDRARGFHVRGPYAEASLLLASVETDLGHHDDAERRLRHLRIMPPPISSRAQLVLGRLTVMRQEPWAEAILCEALEGLEAPAHKSQAWILLGERHITNRNMDAAADAFNEAQKLAGQTQNNRLSARAAMGMGDLCRLQEQTAAAETCYRDAREKAEGDPELLQRVLIRRGDLFQAHGEIAKAREDYRRAADGFSSLGLPLREAWARLRLAQLGDFDEANTSLALFKASDLAAGVAAADACLGNPARSLDWHLERSTEHARNRSNAQRARPPLTRADADRPERRLGAHRMAIAACDVQVVMHLSQQLEKSAKLLSMANPRLTDPNLAKYVAGVDLLAGHRSFEASEVLLNQLLEIRLGGLAGRALVGAVARSPNAALVDGLLEALDGGFDPKGMALAAEVLGWRRERAAVETLLGLTGKDANPTVRKAAVIALGRIGDPRAIDQLVEMLDEPELAEETSVALLLLGEWQGVNAQAQALVSERPGLSRSLGEIVGRYGGPSYLLLLFRTAEKEGPAGMGALQGLGYLGDPRVVPRLLDALGSRDQARAQVASGALELMTGHHEDWSESLLRNRWMTWWESHGTGFQDGLRYRHGRLMDPGLLVDRLSHDDPLVRRSTYDELVISTGIRLPFDAEGPFRVQIAHQAKWRRWWQESASQFPAGRWSFHGDAIG